MDQEEIQFIYIPASVDDINDFVAADRAHARLADDINNLGSYGQMINGYLVLLYGFSAVLILFKDIRI